MNEIKKTVYVMENGKYEISNETYDQEEIYRSLACDLIYKKMENRQGITRITRKKDCAALTTITVYYNNNVKAVYTVKA